MCTSPGGLLALLYGNFNDSMISPALQGFHPCQNISVTLRSVVTAIEPSPASIKVILIQICGL